MPPTETDPAPPAELAAEAPSPACGAPPRWRPGLPARRVTAGAAFAMFFTCRADFGLKLARLK